MDWDWVRCWLFSLVFRGWSSPSYKQIRSDSPNNFILCFLLMTLPFEYPPFVPPSQKGTFPRKIWLLVLSFKKRDVNFYFYFCHLITCSCFLPFCCRCLSFWRCFWFLFFRNSINQLCKCPIYHLTKTFLRAYCNNSVSKLHLVFVGL